MLYTSKYSYCHVKSRRQLVKGLPECIYVGRKLNSTLKKIN